MKSRQKDRQHLNCILVVDFINFARAPRRCDNMLNSWIILCGALLVITSIVGVKGQLGRCGGGYYNTPTQVCCAGVIRPRPPGTPYVACCGTLPYRANNQACCRENPPSVVVRNNPLEKCCGSFSLYNTLNQRCCKGIPVNLPTNAQYHPYECCGSIVHNTDTTLCCNNIVVAKPSTHYTYGCCGITGNIFRENHQICCGGQALPRDPNQPQECCGRTLYNPTTHICCGLTLHTRPSVNGYQFSCCGSRLYNYKTHLCCGGNIIAKSSPYLECCGTGTINTVNTICCNDQAFPKSHGYFTRCCGRAIYNIQNSICCDNTIRPRIIPGFSFGACCGSSIYNTQTHVCCLGLVYSPNYFQLNNPCPCEK